MDQALTWLIELEIADAATYARFLTWLDADPAHREAFASAEAVWYSEPVLDAAKALSAPKKPGPGQ
jgi:transmembrane sensor